MTRTDPIFNFKKSEGKKKQPAANKPSTSTSIFGGGPSEDLEYQPVKRKAKKSKLFPSLNESGPSKTLILDPTTLQNGLSSTPLGTQLEPQPSTSSSQVAPKSSSHRPRKLNGSEDDAIRATKRRIAKRQRKIVSAASQAPRPLFAKCRNRIPEHRTKNKERKGCWKTFKGFIKKRWENIKTGVKWVKSKLGKMGEKVMEKKRKWDRWNPSKEHPVAKFIDETKLAGLKETIKPNRGILYR
jgi:hypothetical protein